MFSIIKNERRSISLSSFCLALFLFYCCICFSQSHIEHLSLEHRVYLAADSYKKKQFVTGMTIEADSMQFYKVKVDLLLNWKTKHSSVFYCLDTSTRIHHFMMNCKEIPAIRLFDSIHQLEIFIKKPVEHISYTANKEEKIYWISELALVRLPKPFNKYWKREVLFHEK